MRPALIKSSLSEDKKESLQSDTVFPQHKEVDGKIKRILGVINKIVLSAPPVT
jgi:hypothetical protein